MKRNLLLITLLFVLAFSACKKKAVEVEVPQTKQIKLLSKVTTGTAVQTFVYDDKLRIIEVKGANARTFTYTGDDLTANTVGPNSRTITYSNGLPVKANANIYTLNLTLTGNKVTKIVYTANTGTVNITYDLSYSGNNLTDIVYNGTLTKYIYGTKKNPYYNSRLKYFIDVSDFDMLAENEVLEKITKDSPRLGSTYTYEYDADGFPTKVIEKRTKPNDATEFTYTTTTYEYETRTVAK